jgi:hypothetical protein
LYSPFHLSLAANKAEVKPEGEGRSLGDSESGGGNLENEEKPEQVLNGVGVENVGVLGNTAKVVDNEGMRGSGKEGGTAREGAEVVREEPAETASVTQEEEVEGRDGAGPGTVEGVGEDLLTEGVGRGTRSGGHGEL